MQNWELISKLSKSPAWAEVRFESTLTDKEVKITEHSDYKEIFVDVDITDVDTENDYIVIF